MRPITTFTEGEEVWLEGKNLNLAMGTKKLAPKQYGPFKILKKISSVAYRLLLLTQMKIHDVFHIDLLTRFHQTDAYGPLYSRPPLDLINNDEQYEIEEIIDVRRRGRGRGCKTEYLIHWKGYPMSKCSWVTDGDLNALELLSEFLNKNSTTTAG
jgi:Chromo (CHRromatin Organisation MOdifier) domain